MAGLLRGRGIQVAFALLCAVGTSQFSVVAASAEDPPPYRSSFGPDGTELTSFGRAGSVGVDQGSHAVYVIDNGKDSLYRFGPKGEPISFSGTKPYIDGNEISGLSFPGLNGASQVAVDAATHTFYVTSGNSIRAFAQDGEPSLFAAGPGAGTSEISGFANLLGVAVDVNGAVYASDNGSGGSGVIKIYAPSGELLTQFETGNPANLAVDNKGAVYVNRFGETILKFTPSEFPVTATTTYAAASEPLSPQAAHSVAVDPETNDIYVSGEFSTNSRLSWYDESGALLATFGGPGQPGEVNVSQGLAIDGDSKRVFASRNLSEEESWIGIFGEEEVVVGAPTVLSTSVRDVTADSATFGAQINPNAAATTVWFEIGLGDCSTNPCTSVPLDGVALGSGFLPVSVSRHIAGLDPGTAYHYRVVAENSFGPKEGPDRTFTTQPVGVSSESADRRAWEMVSPPLKGGGVIVGSFRGLIQAAAGGSGLAYVSLSPIQDDPEGNRAFESSTVLAQRGAPGWESEDITPPHDQVAPARIGDTKEYKLFSPDLSVGLIEQRDAAPLSPQASERTPYLRQNSKPAVYTPLVTGKEGFANVPPGTKFGGNLINAADVRIIHAASDLSRVILRSAVPLDTGLPPNALYVWSEGQLRPVSVLPIGEGGSVISAEGVGSVSFSVRHAVSDDGRRVFWANGGSNPATASALYARDTVAEETVRIDTKQAGASGEGKEQPIFQAASADGETVFFTDSQQLTEDASPSGSDLYRCEVPLGASGCASLIDVSAPVVNSGETARVQGMVPALSDDGSRVYFVARGVLDPVPNELGESPISGQPNLYLWQEGEGVRFVARLSKADSAVWATVEKLGAAGSPKGRYFTFMSQRSLTGYDNRDAITDQPLREIFRYDAATDSLDCISCNPTGAAPVGEVEPDASTREFVPLLVDQREVWGGQAIAATLPQATTLGEFGVAIYQPRSVLDNGRVFFNAIDSLVPADSNGQWDVYQYEPYGVGSCSAESMSAMTVSSDGRCISLISSGTANGEAAFLDAGVTGDDVFFISPERLSVMDVDEELDVYDARVDGVTATLEPKPECLGEACQPLAIAPIDPTLSSASFNGPGNLKPKPRNRCARGKHQVRRNGRVRCVPRKHAGKKQSAGRGNRKGSGVSR
ncbi:MAG TPA: hypothetical protein VIT89_04840 [Solirubrobacterales bacterium]